MMKTDNKTCVTSKDLDQHVQPPSMARVSFNPLWIARRLYKAHASSEDCVDAQADLSLHWSHKSYCRFFLALEHIAMQTIYEPFHLNLHCLSFWFGF